MKTLLPTMQRLNENDKSHSLFGRRCEFCHLLALSTSLATVLAGSSATLAQEDYAETELEEIIVTATRREVGLQDVPISITAFSQQQLDRQGLNSFLDFAQQVPSLGFNNAGGPTFQTLSIRGVGVASGGTAGGGSASTVAVYLDETPVVAPFSRNSSIQPILFDIERVEVLRGPQGTLFGASSMGGAIRYITNKADPSGVAARITSELSTTEGGDESYSVNAMGNLPLADNLAARLVVTYRQDGGYIDRLPLSPPENPAESGRDSDVNASEVLGARLSLRWVPFEQLAITPTIHYQRTELDSTGEADVSADDFLQRRFQDEPQSSRDEYYNLLVEYDLGFADLISSTTDLRREVTAEDFLGALAAAAIRQPFDVLIENTDGDLSDERINPNDLFVQEIRLQSNSTDKFQWLLGAFYLDQNGGEDQDFLAPSFIAFGKSIGAFPAGAPDFAFSERTETTEEQTAVFAELSYTFFDQLEASVGLRWTDSSRGTLSFVDGVLFGASVTDRDVDFDSEITPRYHLAWRPDEDTMLYASASKGFRLGRDQTPISDGPCAADLAALGIDPATSGQVEGDDLWNYEIGGKFSLFNNRLNASVAGYYIDWSNIQQTINLDCGAGFVTNAGEAEIRGVEVEVTARPISDLTMNLALSYTDAEAGSEGRYDIPGQEPGDSLPEVPEWVVSIGAQYTYPINAWLGGYVRGNVTYRSKIYQDFAQTAALTRPSYYLGSARFGVETEFWDMAIYADNLFDEDIIYSFDSTGAESRPARPRTLGVRVTRQF